MTMIQWLQERNLIAKTYTCFGCKSRNNHLMRLAATKKSSDGFRWQCGRFTRSLRRDTWFEGSRLTLQEIILVTFYWCHNAQQQHVRRALQAKSFEGVIDWYHNCRKICMKIALRNNKKYGGPGGIVELCENLYSDRKNNRPGHEKYPQWIIGGIDRRVEFSWRSIKRKLLWAGRKSEYLMSYLAEYLYKKSVHKNQDPFLSFLQVIASTYIVHSDLLENQSRIKMEDSAVTTDDVAELNDAQIDSYNPYEINTYITGMDSREAEESFGNVEDSEHDQSNRKCSSYGLPLTRETLDQILELAKNSGCNNIEIKQSGTRKATRDIDVEMHPLEQNQNADNSLRICIFNEDINIAHVDVPSEISAFSDHNYFDTAMQTDVLITESEHDNLNLPTSEADTDPVPIDNSKLVELADHTYFASVGYVIDDHDYL
ncbi:hypothetical protein CBL_04977 [Carabus blaptoides fortunei]